jgi:hypothetical protein
MATKLTLAAADSATAVPGSAVNQALLGRWILAGQIPGTPASIYNFSTDPAILSAAFSKFNRQPAPTDAVALNLDGKVIGLLRILNLADGSEVVILSRGLIAPMPPPLELADGSKLELWNPGAGATAMHFTPSDGALISLDPFAARMASWKRITDAELASIANSQKQKAVVNNLRQLASAGQQYLLDRGVKEVGYADLIGTQTDNYIRSISPADGEDYTHITITQITTQISVTTKDYGTVTYNL